MRINAKVIGETMSIDTNNKPWLDENGNYLSDKLLMKISKDWDQSVWEQYLSTLEGGLKEKRPRSKKYDKLCELQVSSIFVTEEIFTEKNVLLRKSLKRLTEKQKEAVKLYYFEQLTLSQIAHCLQISVDSVQDRLAGAVKKLGVLMGKYPLHCPIVRGKNIIDSKNHKETPAKVTNIHEGGEMVCYLKK